MSKATVDAYNDGSPYQCGYDAGLNGPNTENCNFSIFSTKDRTKEWERGKRAGDAKRKERANGKRAE